MFETSDINLQKVIKTNFKILEFDLKEYTIRIYFLISESNNTNLL